MQTVLRLSIALIACIAVAVSSGGAGAQALKQILLTEKQVLGFVAAQKDMGRIAETLNSTSDKPADAKIQAELEAVAKKHGFASFSEYDDVAANIAMIMAGIDPRTRAFTEPAVAIQKEIDEVRADKTISEKERAQMLDELNEALKAAAPIQYPENIKLVLRFYERIDAVLQ